MKIRPERIEGATRESERVLAPEAEAASRHGHGFARSRRRALALAGATAIAPGVRAATPDVTAADPPARLRTGWILRPDDR
jgi:hypothetical protein